MTWGFSAQDNLTLNSKVTSAIRDKLLELANKNLEHNYPRTPPKFCCSCIEKVTDLYPELASRGKRKTTEEHGPAESLPSKTTKYDDCHDAHDEDPYTNVERYHDEDIQESPESLLSKTTKHDHGDDAHDEDPFTQHDTSFENYHDEHIHESPEQSERNIRKINLDELTFNEICQLAYDLEKLESDTAKHYALAARDKYLKTLLSTQTERHDSSGTTITAFISGLAGAPLLGSSNSPAYTSYKLYKTVESVLILTAVNLILPMHFRESILIYTLTGSKLALQILGSGVLMHHIRL